MSRKETGNVVIDTVDSAIDSSIKTVDSAIASGFDAVDSVLDKIFNFGHSEPAPESKPGNSNETVVICHCHEVSKK